jgi:NitT/TauT family transport system permease protein
LEASITLHITALCALAASVKLQSIPVLSFLPGVMLAMVALFPQRQFGVELGAILLIFTGQV